MPPLIIRSTDQSALPQLLAAAGPASQSLDGKLSFLRRVPLFAGVADAALVPLASRARWQVYAKGEIVTVEGDTTNDVFFIAEGAVRVVVRTASGYEMILADLYSGDFFGELAAIDRDPRCANGTTLLQSRLCVIPGDAFMDLALSSREVGRRLFSILSRLLRRKDKRLLEFNVLPVRERLIVELLRLSRDRGGGERVVSPPLPQHVIAARVGIRRESVSREMAEMSRSGLITVGRSAIVLHHPEALQAEIDARLQGDEQGAFALRRHGWSEPSFAAKD
jgi:CRP/FNR family cyclic AMP-dependent transcriptional regulator